MSKIFRVRQSADFQDFVIQSKRLRFQLIFLFRNHNTFGYYIFAG